MRVSNFLEGPAPEIKCVSIDQCAGQYCFSNALRYPSKQFESIMIILATQTPLKREPVATVQCEPLSGVAFLPDVVWQLILSCAAVRSAIICLTLRPIITFNKMSLKIGAAAAAPRASSAGLP